MDHQSEKESILLNGRWFTREELNDVKETIRLFPKLSRYELALTLCEGLSWFTANGKYKIDACTQMLKKLEADNEIVLPEKRRTKGAGKRERITISSKTTAGSQIHACLPEIRPIRLLAVRRKQNLRLWNEYIERHHPIGYKRPFGAHQRYFIWSDRLNQRLGCLLFSAAAWSLEARDQWIGWNRQDRSQRLHLVVNNTRFLIFPWVRVPHLASHVLGRAVQRVRRDFGVRYGYEPVLLETFVDLARYEGTSYRAANWMSLGETKGRGRMDRHSRYPSSPKRIYVYPLVSDFRIQLRGGEGK